VFLAPHLLVGAPPPWSVETLPAVVHRRRLGRVPRLHGAPFLWEERDFGGPAVTGGPAPVIGFGLIVGGVGVGATLLVFCRFSAFSLKREEAIRTYRPLAGDLAAAMLPVIMIGAAVRTAGSVSRERDRKTLGSVMVLPVRVEDILWPKWLGG